MLYPPQNTLSTAHNGQHPTHILPDSTISPKDYVPGTFYTVRKLLRKAARKTENTESSGIGIENMKKRVRMLGGTMQIQKENGFRIFITVPKNEGKR